jgi:hypothetical protein|tara:strand:+ start:18 stop:197 length:180 start_codon:yes stop_codon:yes gene_type:complete
MSTRGDFTGKPDNQSLENKEASGSPSFGGKSKSVWQGFVDAAGFAKKHPKLMLKKFRKK